MSEAASDELIADFVDESLQSLRGLADHLQQFQQHPHVEEPIHAVFRAVHSIKGCAGFLELLAIKQFSHSLENTLDDVRKKKLPLTADLCHALVDGFDLLDTMVQRIGEHKIDDSLSETEQNLLDRVARLEAEALGKSLGDDPETQLLIELQQLAEEIALAGISQSADWSNRLNQLTSTYSANDEASKTSVASQLKSPATMKGTVVAYSKNSDINSEGSANANQGKARYVRIREEKLDEFLNHVSRLFITCELYKDIYSRLSATGEAPSLVEEIRQINRVFSKQTAHLQKSVVSLRRVTASVLFSKFPTMARTLASQLGKKVNVQLLGEDVEIDKTLVEELDSSLTHMIRNVVDHGIEGMEDRLANGKSETGQLILKAEITKTHVIITVQDDGRGIDPNRLRRKMVEKGMMTESQVAALSDQEAVELIFMAGLSTAEQISEISGRGVGLDVVRTKLREHNGDVIVESYFGQGTKFRLEVPLREAGDTVLKFADVL